MKEITSVFNPEIKNIVRLHDAGERAKQNLFIVEGKRALKTALERLQLKQLYITQDHRADIHELCDNNHVTLVSDTVMKKISTSTHASGMLAVCTIPAQPELDILTNGLVLAQITDPGNMGTLIRTAVACGVKSVVIIEGTDPWSPKVVQASAGTIAHVNIFKLTWHTLRIHKKHLALYGLVVHNGLDIQTITNKNHLLVIGNEAHGLPLAWQQDCDALYTLPMPGKTESLNAAIAGSIALYITTVLHK
jgi:TrmH family RNA methyltransferase